MHHSTYIAYGTRIPDTPSHDLEDVLENHDAVTYLKAGDYDRDMTFLVISSTFTDLRPGTFRSVVPQEPSLKNATWDQQLHHAAAALGEHDIPMPAWLVVPDLS